MMNRGHTCIFSMAIVFASATVLAQDTCPSSSYLSLFAPAVPGFGGELIYENMSIDGDTGYLCSTYFDMFQEQSYYYLNIVDVSDPQTPHLIAQPELTAQPAAIRVVNDIAYIADFYGLRIIDLSQPLQPNQLALYPTSSFPMDLQIQGTKAYIARRDDGLEIVDISDPQLPTHLGELDLPGESRAVVIDDDFAYLVDEIALRVVDISNPANPTLAGSSMTSADAWDLSVGEGGIVYLADRASGSSVMSSLQVYDTTNPNAPSPIASLSYGTFGSVRGVHVMGNQLFVVHGSSGLQSLDISNPSSPQPNGEYDQAPFIHAMASHDGLLYATSSNVGLVIIDPSVACGQCQVDLNADGVLDFFDVSLFISAFSNQLPQGDFTGDGVYDFFDVSSFINLYHAGCP